MLKLLSYLNNQCCPNLIAYGKGPIAVNDVSSEKKQYLILENEEKGNLFDYVFLPNRGFDEKYGKPIFKKILEGIKACHDAGICHGNIKHENLLLDGNFNPKIYNFSFATLTRGINGDNLLSSKLGTYNYSVPEILEGRNYDGIKADIFKSWYSFTNFS